MEDHRTSRPAARVVGWLAGLPVLVGLTAGTLALLEPDLAARQSEGASALVRSLAAPHDEPWLRIVWDGRDARAEGEAPDEAARTAARRGLAALPTLRTLDDRIGLVVQAAPFAWRAVRIDPTTFAQDGHRPAEVGRAALAARLVADLPPGEVRLTDDTRAARGAPPDFPAKAAYALGLLAHLAPGGRAVLTDATLSLNGAPASGEAATALRAMLAAPPAGLTIGETALRPPRVEPFLWSAARGPEGLRLDGFVPTPEARTRFAMLLGEAGDGGAVIDRTELADGFPLGVDATRLARLAASLLGLLAQGSVSLEGDRLSVAGTALDAEAGAEIEALLAAGLAAAGLTRGTLDVRAPSETSYRAAIRREPGRVILSGHLPDEDTRRRLLETARPIFFGERVVDHTRLAPGAPEGFAAALESGLAGLAGLAAGETVATGRTVSLAGESLYAGPARRLREAGIALPEGWAGTVSVRGPDEPERFDPAACRLRLARATAGEPLRFDPGSADLAPAFYPTLDAVAALVRACPEGRMVVAGHRDPPGVTASVPKEVAPKDPVPKEVAPKDPAPKPSAKGGAGRSAPKDAAPATAASDTPDEADLPRRRALAAVDYLVKAGAPPERTAAAPLEQASQAGGLAFTLVP